MNEIEKIYKNAGIKPEYKDCCIITDKYLNYETELSYEDLMDKECPHNQECTDECEYAYNKIIYPPFTAEKQLEIVKMILFSTWWMNLKRLQFAEKFDEGLAQMINELWQDLSLEEKQQVKGILE